MSLFTIAGVVIFLISYILSQRLALNAREKLDDAFKLKISDIFARRNVNYSTIVFAIVIVYLITMYTLPQYVTVFSIIYAVVFLIYFISKMFLNIRKLKEIAAPPEYIRSIVASFGVFTGGAVAAIIVIAVGNISHVY